MRNSLVLTSVFVLLMACKSASVIQHDETVKSRSIDSVFLEFRALDLTEDMSSLSSQNDEIVVLAYRNGRSGATTLLFSGNYIVTKENERQRIAVGTLGDLTNESVTILKIERDTEHSITQMDEMVQLHFVELLKHYQQHGNFGIEKFIDDNDIVGIKTIPAIQPNSTYRFDFNGIFKLDRYHYKLVINTK